MEIFNKAFRLWTSVLYKLQMLQETPREAIWTACVGTLFPPGLQKNPVDVHGGLFHLLLSRRWESCSWKPQWPSGNVRFCKRQMCCDLCQGFCGNSDERCCPRHAANMQTSLFSERCQDEKMNLFGRILPWRGFMKGEHKELSAAGTTDEAGVLQHMPHSVSESLFVCWPFPQSCRWGTGTAAARRSVGRTGQKTTSEQKRTTLSLVFQLKDAAGESNTGSSTCSESTEGEEERTKTRAGFGGAELLHLPTAMILWTYFPQLHVTAGS